MMYSSLVGLETIPQSDFLFPSSPTPVVIIEPFSDRTGPLRHVSKEMGGLTDDEMCLRRHPDNVTFTSTPPLSRPNLTAVYNVHTLQGGPKTDTVSFLG